MKSVVMAVICSGVCLVSTAAVAPANPAVTIQSDPMVGYWTDGVVLLRVWKDEQSFLGRIERCQQGAAFVEKMYSWRMGEAAFEVVSKEVKDGVHHFEGVTRDWNEMTRSHELRVGFEIQLHRTQRGLELAITRGGDTIYFTPAEGGGR